MTHTSPFCQTCGAMLEAEYQRCPHCGHGQTADRVQDADLLCERYRLGKLLGSGGFSMVYRASDILHGERTVAIKRIAIQGLSAEQVIESTETFNREVHILSALTHPQVPTLYEYFHDQQAWYLVLEYIEGQTLEAFLTNQKTLGQPLTVTKIVKLALQLCVVLNYLHTRQPPVVFRDLKPDNIMLTPAGSLCLIDFGIARFYRRGQAQDTQRLGSPGYAAPEQYGRAQSSPQSDIYSLGALLRFLLSGQDPSDGKQDLPAVHLANEAGEAQLQALVETMLAADPNERPASIREVTAILQSIHQQHTGSKTSSLWQPPIPQTPPPAHVFSLPAQQFSSGANQGLFSRRNMLVALSGLAITGGAFILGAQALTSRQQYRQPRRHHNWSSDTSDTSDMSDASNTSDTALEQEPTTYPTSFRDVANVKWSSNGVFLAATASTGDHLTLWNNYDGSLFLDYDKITPSFALRTVAWSPNRDFLVLPGDKGLQIY
ncbi:MAG TPA: serine/threonine-protein kinase, partial [Ktedonobacteraceae bacterium]|nr:serine/threonine-protein kinase [Ktedonobacteraceae bacterium]